MKNTGKRKEEKDYSENQQKAIYLATLASVVAAVLIVFNGGQSLERSKLLDQYYLEIDTHDATDAGSTGSQILNTNEYESKNQPSGTLSEAVWVDNIEKSYGNKNDLPKIMVASYDKPVIEATMN